MLNLKESNLVEKSQKIWELSESSYEFGSPWTVEQFQKDLCLENSFYYVLEQNGVWLGFISGYWLFDEADISHVVVAANHQGSGNGRRLLMEAMDIFQKEKLVRVSLEVRESNRKAIDLYRKIGFKEIHKRKDYYHHPLEDGWLMQCKIGGSN